MGFRAVHAQWGTVFAHLPGLGCGRDWADVHRVRPPEPLTCDECQHGMHAKVSPTGLRFFAHDAGAPDCASAGESLAHHLLKLELAEAAREAGAHAEMELRGPEGTWRADVMASDPGGTWRVALEAQLSPITSDDIKARTERMRADSVASVWVSDRAAPSWLGAVPSVRLEHKDGGLAVAEGLMKFTGRRWEPAPPVPLAEFLWWVFAQRVVPHTRQAPSGYDMRPLETIWTAPRYVQQEVEYLVEMQRRARAEEARRARAEEARRARRLAEEAEMARLALQRQRELALRGSREAQQKARWSLAQKRVRRVMAQDEQAARAQGGKPPQLGERQHVADHAVKLLARDRGLVTSVGWSIGDARYAGGIPLVGDNGLPVAVIDPEPDQVDDRAARLLAGLRLLFTSSHRGTQFLKHALRPADDAGGEYWVITMEVPPAGQRRAPAVQEQKGPAAPGIPPSPAAYPVAAPRTPPPVCACTKPVLVAMLPHGVEDAEPWEQMTASAAMFSAACQHCGRRYDKPWRRLPG